MRLLIDLDGTCVEMPLREIVKKHFHVDIGSFLINAYDLSDLLGVTNKAIDLMFKDQVYGKAHFYPRVLNTLNQWSAKGYGIVINSHRTEYMGEEGLAKWLIENKIPFQGIDSKGNVGVYDFAIDDRPSKLQDSNSKIKILFNQTWNSHCFDLHKNLVRVNSWEEIEKIIG